MKTLILAAWIATILTVAPASAADRLPYIVSAAGLWGDTISSYRFSVNGSGCLEGNARYQHADQTFNAKRATIETAVQLGVVWGVLWLTHRQPQNKVARWLGKGLAYFSGGIGGYNAARNVALCGL